MKVLDLQSALVALGYSVKNVKGNAITLSVSGDRISLLKELSEKFGGVYNPTGGGSSVGRAEFGKVVVNAKPASGGGSGAGSAITDLAESGQCAYCAAAWYGNDFSEDTLKSVESNIDVTATISDIMKLPSHWQDSMILTAHELKKKYGKRKYKFHRGSSWVSSLEAHWRSLNKTEKAFANLNKWSPADIYMVTLAGSRIKLTETKSISELNDVMRQALISGDIIPVSLKQVKKTATIEEKNVSAKKTQFKYEEVTVGKRGFLLSGDSYLTFDKGVIQFRKFGSTWQGEIKGKNANMGKISGGPINEIFSKHNVKLLKQAEVLRPNPNLLKKLYTFYKHFESGTPLPEKAFTEAVLQKDANWWVSKFLSAQLAYEIDKQPKSVKDSIVTAMLSYAASETDISGPYVKVS